MLPPPQFDLKRGPPTPSGGGGRTIQTMGKAGQSHRPGPVGWALPTDRRAWRRAEQVWLKLASWASAGHNVPFRTTMIKTESRTYFHRPAVDIGRGRRQSSVEN